MPHTLVILGGGYAGVTVAHSMLQNTPTSTPITVLLVAPHDALYWQIASIRVIVPDAIPESQVFFPLAEGFAQYPASRFRLISAAATAVNPDDKTVTLSAAPPSDVAIVGGSNTIAYDTLVIATGSSFTQDLPFKCLGSTAETKASLANLRARIAQAIHITIAGAGLTGVETTGELGAALLGSAASGRARSVTLISADDLPLADRHLPSLRRTLLSQLQSIGVKVILSSRVEHTETVAGGKEGSSEQTKLTLRTKTGETSTLTTDLYIPAFGLIPNTSFLPPSLISPTTRRVPVRPTMQAVGYDDVFAIGDAGDLQHPTAKNAEDQGKAVARILRERIVEGKTTALTPWNRDDRVICAVSVGPGQGSGQYGNWKLPSVGIWFAKGRTLGIRYLEKMATGTHV